MLAIIYFTIFAAVLGGSFALMWANIKSITEMNKPIKTVKYPEAPQAGEELMYVDFSREKLERLYEKE